MHIKEEYNMCYPSQNEYQNVLKSLHFIRGKQLPMRYLELSFITETNSILKQIEPISLSLEAYSCKYTKKQKKRQKFRSVYSHLTNTIEMANLNTHRRIQRNSFTKKHFSDMKNDIFLILMRYKIQDAENMLRLITLCIQNTIGLNDTHIFSFNNDGSILTTADSNILSNFNIHSNSSLCFLFYNKNRKRVVLLTLYYNLNETNCKKLKM